MLWIFLIVIIVGIVCIAFVDESNHSKVVKERGELNAKAIAAIENFNLTKQIVGIENSYIFAVDENSKRIAFVKKNHKELVSFEQVISVEIFEDNTILNQKSSLRTIGGAVVGGAVAGGAGAVIGGLSGATKQNKTVSKVQVKIKLRNINHASFTIDCFDCRTMTTYGKPVKPDSMQGQLYKQGLRHAQRIADIICVIIDTTDRTTKNNLQKDSGQSMIIEGIADEIRKLADLNAKGILSDDEFNTQKRTLLERNIPKDNLVSGMEESTCNDEVPNEIAEALAKGNTIEAIKYYVDHTGCSLKEAKDYINSLR